jgi:hypothetical protein
VSGASGSGEGPQKLVPDPRLIVTKSGMMPRTVWMDAWAWRCGECGYLGVDCGTDGIATAEGIAHLNEKHPR